jgi:hypothetical protein
MEWSALLGVLHVACSILTRILSQNFTTAVGFESNTGREQRCTMDTGAKVAPAVRGLH